jgi:thiamine transport system substrate-binding protein
MVAFLIGCGGNDEPVQITVMTHDSFAISEAILTEFEEANNVEIVILPSGDAGAVLNQAILTEDNPLADLLYGVDNTFLSRALDADIFEAYESDALTAVPDTLELDSSHRLTPVDFGDVCLNYDKNWFEEKGIEPPQTLAELTEPAYESLTVVENPSTSSPGLAFLLATIGVFGTDGEYTYQDYWADLRANDVLVTDGWESAYYGQFSGAGDGSRPIVVSYASSPPAEVVFADPPIDEPPTAAVTTPDTCFRQIEFVGILKGTEHREQAEAFIDFMLSQTFQEDIPLNMFVFPANSEAALPDVFTQWTAVPESPVLVDSAEIEANRASWIETWTNVVLR